MSLSGLSGNKLFRGALAVLFALAVRESAFAAEFVWPLGNSTTPDAMTTSFGPRINRNRWDFHDGIDLPADLGTPIYATRAATVRRAGCGSLTVGCADPTSPYRSRHVILEMDDPTDPGQRMFVLHLHLSSTVVAAGDVVAQGQLLGAVGDDDASYSHLHFEVRKGNLLQISSVHPLGYMPYPDTANFTAPVLNRFNRLGALMAARLLFDAPSRLEGDLLRVEVDLRSGGTLLEMRIVDFNDKTTVYEGIGDEFVYVNDIGVEGYQKSNMVADGRADLGYGILVRNLPTACDTLAARVVDVSGNVAASAEINVPDQTATDELVDFEDGAMPPAGWRVVTSSSGSGTTVVNDAAAGRRGSRGMLSIDDSTSETSPQRAGIEYPLPTARFEWGAEGWFNPTALGLATGQAVYPLHFLSGAELSVAARIHNMAGSIRAGIIVRNPDGTLTGRNSSATIDRGVWREWRLRVLRIGTRETTAVLYLSDPDETLVEWLRVNWDSRITEPGILRAGIGLSSAGATATMLTDDGRVTEKER